MMLIARRAAPSKSNKPAAQRNGNYTEGNCAAIPTCKREGGHDACSHTNTSQDRGQCLAKIHTEKVRNHGPGPGPSAGQRHTNKGCHSNPSMLGTQRTSFPPCTSEHWCQQPAHPR